MKNRPKESILLAAQEIAFAKALASNDKALRDRALRKLKKWLTSKSQRNEDFSEEGFMRLWKGLFYCVWMSDKPLIQEECIETISSLIHCFSNYEDALMFIRCFFLSMTHGWFGLDSHRMDKYLMLVRRFLRHTFDSASKLDWDHEKVILLHQNLSQCFTMAPVGMILHLADIYMEELSKIGKGKLNPKTTLELIKPFAQVMMKSSDPRLLTTISNNVFFYLLRQSEEGIKHSLKFQAWKQSGFPEGDIDVMEEIENDENGSDEEMEKEVTGSDEEMENDIEETDEASLDIRAGRVNVELHPIHFDAKQIADYLDECKKDADVSTKCRKQMSHVIKKMNVFAEGEYPLGLKKFEVVEKEDEDELIDQAAEDLFRFDEESIDNKKKRKERKRKTSEWEVSTIEDTNETSLDTSANGSWIVTEETVQIKPKRPKIDNSDTSDSHLNKSKKPKINPSESSKPELIKSKNDLIKSDKSKKKKKQKNNNVKNEWGDSNWTFPVEQETEIIVQPKKINGKSPKTPKSLKSEKLETTFTTPLKNSTPGSNKKVLFSLKHNMSQEEKVYQKMVKQRPSIPYDANKKPAQGVLKWTPNSSPINPFYKFKKS